MNNGIAREILSDCDILKHLTISYVLQGIP